MTCREKMDASNDAGQKKPVTVSIFAYPPLKRNKLRLGIAGKHSANRSVEDSGCCALGDLFTNAVIHIVWATRGSMNYTV